MDSNIPKRIFNEELKLHLRTEQYANYLNRQVQSLLKNLEDELVAATAKIDPSAPMITEWKRNRLQKLEEQVRKILQDHYQQIQDMEKEALQEIAELQSEAVPKALNKALTINLFDISISPELVQSIVEHSMIDGKILKEWWNKTSEATRKRFMLLMTEGTMKVQLGTLQGESIGELISRIRGNKQHPPIMDISRREAAAIVRTSVMQVSNTVRIETYKANQKVLKGIQIIATLDQRTSAGCRAKDGLQYDLDGNPIGNNFPFPGLPPYHFNCRTCTCPLTKTFAELSGKNSQLSKQQLQQLDKLPAGMRASMGGEVPTMNYDEWLKEQPEKLQQEILGQARWELWKDNKLDMIDLIDNKGNTLTIKQLRNKYE
ncbi:MAG: Phage Mu protein F like protein [Syntrophus sp. PtaB.Bin001]|nr:MAG: Phage Mu protein F like protein [Syntrophus sp. PtaB.Bin001]